jgi:hypothetical protein
MFFCRNDELVFVPLEFKQGDCLISHELGRHGSADQIGELIPTHRFILFDLDDAQSVLARLGLDRNNIVDSLTIQTDVQFVSFHLPNMRSRCS